MSKNDIMLNIRCDAANIDDAWKFWYNLIAKEGKQDVSRDGDVIGEVINAVTVLNDPTRNIMQNDIRKMSFRYAVGELLWYLSRNRSIDAIRHYSHGWDRMSDDGKLVNSNYGYCIFDKFGFDQLEFVENKLRSDANTRQAIIHIKEASNKESKDINCTVCLQFFVRDGKLFLTTYMRSNDLWFGFPFDVFQFTCLQVYLAMKLNVEIGSYTHIAGSLHLYKRDYEKSLENIKNVEEIKNV